MKIEQHVSLKEYNTFAIAAKAKAFCSVTQISELKEALKTSAYSRKFILGAGSNMLLKKDLDALVIHIGLKGIEIKEESESHVLLEVAAGENWHKLVMYCVNKGYGGLENLALIPGNTGTAPIQNIGAYGVELKDVFYSCEAIHRETLETKTFPLEACCFGYRDSIFKNEAKDTYVITSVTFKLTKSNHTLHTDYGAIREVLESKKIKNPTIQDIANAVIEIRSSKLPDPKKIGNSGSFFKNPIVTKSQFLKLQKDYPDVPSYPITEELIKVPAGWLIEQAGYKGKRFGDAGVHSKQALVLVNYDKASGADIWNLAMEIQHEVELKFGITISPEVNIVE